MFFRDYQQKELKKWERVERRLQRNAREMTKI